MHKIKVRLDKGFVKRTGKKQRSVGGNFITEEWQIRNVDKAGLERLECLGIFEIKVLSGQSEAACTDKSDKPIKKKRTAIVSNPAKEEVK